MCCGDMCQTCITQGPACIISGLASGMQVPYFMKLTPWSFVQPHSQEEPHFTELFRTFSAPVKQTTGCGPTHEGSALQVSTIAPQGRGNTPASVGPHKGQQRFGQHYLCLTLDHNNLEKAAKALQMALAVHTPGQHDTILLLLCKLSNLAVSLAVCSLPMEVLSSAVHKGNYPNMKCAPPPMKCGCPPRLATRPYKRVLLKSSLRKHVRDLYTSLLSIPA